mmetsp:Transcript_49442/g.137446  ORF Transcript_49442/g.137446 Transcript_49442/m.137446 type:complete len:218 (+) Transcript_49442:1087-1740(+)
MALLGKVEVEAFACLLQRQDLIVRIILEDELLQVAESAPVRHLLPDLDDGVEGVRGEGPLALLALLVDHLELHDHRLLQNAGVGHLLLHCDLHPDALGVLLRPDEGGIHQPHFLAQATDALEANAQEFARLGLALRPPRPVVPLAVAALLEHHLSRDALNDGHLGLQALRTAHRLVRDHGHAATAAEHRGHVGAGILHGDVILALHAHPQAPWPPPR